LPEKALPGPGDRIAGCTLVRKVGEGGMGVVFEARDGGGETRAVKILRPGKAGDPATMRAFVNEGEATGSVDHENVVTVLTQGEEGGHHFITMEFVDGTPLHLQLRERGRLPWREATEIVAQVARALGAAHSLGLVHRDVKPDNVLLYRDGRARLTDFGIVKDISSLKGYLLKGRRVGTAVYASPEQCLDKRLDAATDMYSLGATFYHLVCGRHPFTGDSAQVVMKKHVRAPLVPPHEIVPDLPRPLSNAIERMMAKKQTDRYESMDRLVADLELILSGKVAIGAGGKRVDTGRLRPLRRARRPAEATVESAPRISGEAVLVIVAVLVVAVFLLLVLLR